MDVTWNVAGELPGVTFEVERRGSRLRMPREVVDHAVISGLSGCRVTDQVEPDGVLNYRYRVRACLSGIVGGWVDAVGDQPLVVGGPEPGEVDLLRAWSTSLGNVRIEWCRPRWEGHGDRIKYEIEWLVDDWVPVHSLPYRSKEGPFIFVNEGLGPSDQRFRVRSLNKYGAGPWREVSVSRERMSDDAARDLRVKGLLCRLSGDGLLELYWDEASRVPVTVSDVECWDNGRWVSAGKGTGASYICEIGSGLDRLCFYRVRKTFGGFRGPWSDALGVLVFDIFQNQVQLPPPELFPADTAVRLVAVDPRVKGPSGVLALYSRAQGLMTTVQEFGHDLKRASVDLWGQVVGPNRGGWVADWCGEEGFIPHSRAQRDPDRLGDRIGQFVRLAVVEVKPNGQFILDKRGAGQRVAVLRCRVGDVVEGRVSSVEDFGVFVDLGEGEGIIHVSQLSRKWVGHPREVVNQGDVVRVKVIKVDLERERIGLSLKQVDDQ